MCLRIFIHQDDNVFKSATKDSSLTPSWTPDTSSGAPKDGETLEDQTETFDHVHLNPIPEVEPPSQALHSRLVP